MTSQKKTNTSVPRGDDAQVQALLEKRHEIAEELHNSTSRAQAERALARLTDIDESTQMVLLKALAKQQDTDAADVLLAINELTPNKAIRKESRRALIQLAGNKIYPSWTPEAEKPTTLAASQAPRFWKVQATLLREQGELEVILCWE